MTPLALISNRSYGFPVTVDPVTDLGRSNSKRRTSAHHTIAGAFFVSAIRCYGGCAWDTFGCAGFSFCPGRPTRVQLPPSSLGRDWWQLPSKRSFTMRNCSPSTHAAAWKARAFAALRSDSSLSVRLSRYNAAMSRARALEAQGGAQ